MVLVEVKEVQKTKKGYKMNKNIENFKKENLPKKIRKNALLHRKDEIVELNKSGYTQEQIAQYIKLTYQIRTSRIAISKLLKELQNGND